MENRRLSPQNYRKDHEDFGEVQGITYRKAKIFDFGVEKYDPITPNDTARVVMDEGGTSDFLPIFYHCKEDFYTKDTASLNAAQGSLKDAALAFEPDREVIVMMRDGGPYAILGPVDHPRSCIDILKFDLYGYTGVFATDPSARMRYHFRVSDQSLICDMNVPCPDSRGKDYGCTKAAIRLCGTHEVQFGTVVYFMGDWLIEHGPIFFIFMVYAIGMPAPTTGQIWMVAAPASKELKEQVIEAGQRKEEVIPDRIFQPMPPQEFYPGFFAQTRFQALLFSKFGGYKANAPRWVFSELFSQEWPD